MILSWLRDCPQNLKVTIEALVFAQLFILQTIFQPPATIINRYASRMAVHGCHCQGDQCGCARAYAICLTAELV